MNVDTMPAGRELDALVAEKVMGYRIVPMEDIDQMYSADRWEPFVSWVEGKYLPNSFVRYVTRENVIERWRGWSPSTDIAAAWEVLEKIAPGREISLDRYPGSERWLVVIRKDNLLAARLWAETAPLAICRAALKAVGQS